MISKALQPFLLSELILKSATLIEKQILILLIIVAEMLLWVCNTFMIPINEKLVNLLSRNIHKLIILTTTALIVIRKLRHYSAIIMFTLRLHTIITKQIIIFVIIICFYLFMVLIFLLDINTTLVIDVLSNDRC